MPQRIDRQVDLGAIRFLGSVIASASSTFGGRTQRATVEDGGGRQGLSVRSFAQNSPNIVDNGLKASRFDPAARLLIHYPPRWKVAGKIAPLCSRAHQPPERIEDVPERMLSLRGIRPDKRQIGRKISPFFIS